MSLSNEERKDQIRRLLIQLVDAVGDDKYFLEVMVEPSEDAYAHFVTTTWTQLAAKGYLHDEGGAYELTPRGWLKGMELSGRLASAPIRDRATALAKALKASVKGRENHYDELVDDHAIAAETGIPIGWIENALYSNLLNAVFPHSDLTVRNDGRCTFYVPPSFGLRWLDEVV
jgi:hypothetical protein